MAVDTYDVTVALVLNQIGGADVSKITSSSKHISTTMVQAWIDRAAGRVNGLVAAEKLSVTTEAAEAAAGMAIMAWTKARIYERMNRHEAKRDALDEYADAIEFLRKFPEEVDSGLTDSNRVKSNIDTTDPTSRKFQTRNSTRGDGFRGW